MFLWGVPGASLVVTQVTENTGLEWEGEGGGKADSGHPFSTFILKNKFRHGKT